MKKLIQIALGLIYSVGLLAQPTDPQGDASYTYLSLGASLLASILQELELLKMSDL
jgi:hypothetical protein